MILTINGGKLELCEYIGSDKKVLTSVPATVEGANQLGKFVFENKLQSWNVSSSVDEFQSDFGIDLFEAVQEGYSQEVKAAFQVVKESIMNDYGLSYENFKDIWDRLEPFMS